MDWFVDYFSTYLYGLKVVAITLAILMLISGIDDLFIDIVYWVRRVWRSVTVYRKNDYLDYKALYEPQEKALAIMVPAWNEPGLSVIWRVLPPVHWTTKTTIYL